MVCVLVQGGSRAARGGGNGRCPQLPGKLLKYRRSSTTFPPAPNNPQTTAPQRPPPTHPPQTARKHRPRPHCARLKSWLLKAKKTIRQTGQAPQNTPKAGFIRRPSVASQFISLRRRHIPASQTGPALPHGKFSRSFKSLYRPLALLLRFKSSRLMMGTSTLSTTSVIRLA